VINEVLLDVLDREFAAVFGMHHVRLPSQDLCELRERNRWASLTHIDSNKKISLPAA
jgi:hypothetical protein